MRIALVVAGPYPALRGSQVLVRHLALGLRERGHAVHLVAYGRAWGRLAPLARPGPSASRLLLDLGLVVRLWRVVRREAIDVIHAHNYEAAIAGLLVGRTTGRPLVYHGHSALAEELPTYACSARGRRLAARLGQLLDAQVPRRADFCIAVTEELGDVLRRAGVAERGLACITPAGAPPEVGPPPSPTAGARICYAGNLDGYQNLDFLLRSFARVRQAVPAARLTLVTHADGGRDAHRLGALGGGVELVRAGSYDEVRARLAAADVAVCPRTARSGFPMKLLNYMAAGKAIVAAAGSAKGLRDGVTGRVVADGDEAAFAAAVVDLLGDAALRHRLGSNARRAVESPRAWEEVLDRVEDIYRQVSGREAPALARRAS
jgi:1,2-diacylglycerol 3-alpha-glucosyltransferase